MKEAYQFEKAPATGLFLFSIGTISEIIYMRFTEIFYTLDLVITYTWVRLPAGTEE